MRLVGFARTRLFDDLAEQDLEEQERSLAEFCAQNNHELTHVVTSEASQKNAFDEALQSEAEGVVVIDPLVLADDIDTANDVATKLCARKLHLFMVYKQQHIDASSADGQKQIVESCAALFGKHGV